MGTQFDQDTIWDSILYSIPPSELLDFEGNYERDIYHTDFTVGYRISYDEKCLTLTSFKTNCQILKWLSLATSKEIHNILGRGGYLPHHFR